jgi:MerR family transcriptional regulator, redox-sensitive transcriptional activator SoxR
MLGLSIGEVARRSGLAPSALRYYEKAGLLPPAARVSGQRRYDSAVLGRIRIVQAARGAGFTIGEIRVFLTGFASNVAPRARWRTLADRKLLELNTLLQRVEAMKAVLETSFRCNCPQISDCERAIARCEKGRTKKSRAPR